MLTRLRNAILVKSEKTKIRYTKINFGIVKILKKEGFIKSFEMFDNPDLRWKDITIIFKYKGPKQTPCITELKRVSKPGLRIYVSYKKIPKILGGIGLSVFAI